MDWTRRGAVPELHLVSMLCFALGVGLAHQVRELPNLCLAVSLIPLGISSIYLPVVRPMFAFLFGVFYLFMHAHLSLGQALPMALEKQDLWVSGEIVSLVERQNLLARFEFRIDEASRNAHSVSVPKRVKLAWYQPYPSLQAGQHWRALIRLKRPHSRLNEAGFDYERHLFARGIRAQGYVRTKPIAPVRLPASSSFSLSVWRQAVFNKLSDLVPDSDVKGLIIALAMGERQGIDAPQWQILRNSGTSHLVAISGLHVGLIATMFYFLVNHFWRDSSGLLRLVPAQQMAAACAIISGLGYALLAGFSIPTQRAWMMLLAFMWAPLIRVRMAASQRWLWALVLVLLVDPMAPLSAGFWLSFTAVAVILYYFQNQMIHVPPWRQMFKLQFVVALGLLPFLPMLFQGVSLISPLANLVAVPFVSFLILPIVLLGTLMAPISDAMATGLFRASEILLEPAWQLLQQALQWPSSYITVADPGLLACLLAVLGMVWLLAPVMVPARSLGIFLFLPLFFSAVEKPKPGEFWFDLLDVGQGLSVVIRTATHSLVYDVGPARAGSFDSGAQIVLPFLHQAQVNQLDMLIVSHGDNDHAGGLAAVLNAFPAAQLRTSAWKTQIPHQALPCLAGQSWNWDGIQFDMLHPDSEDASGNNGSCVLRVVNSVGGVLLTGDIEKEAEIQLLSRARSGLAVDLLVAPHHGSRTSSSIEFIRAVRPQWVLFAVGYLNRYGFPKPEIVDRYRQMGTSIASTAQTGQISFRFTEAKIEGPDFYREKYRKYWHDVPR